MVIVFKLVINEALFFICIFSGKQGSSIAVHLFEKDVEHEIDISFFLMTIRK